MKKDLKNKKGRISEYYNKLVNFLELQLIIDKAIDFLLIFVGLYAALALENSLKDNDSHEKYKLTLKNIYLETQSNKYFSNRMLNDANEKSIHLESVYTDFYLDSEKSIKDPNLYLFDTIDNFKRIYFSTLDFSEFKNKSLLAEIINLQEGYSEAEYYNKILLDEFLEFDKNYSFHKDFNTYPDDSDIRNYFILSKNRSVKKDYKKALELVTDLSEILEEDIENELKENYNITINSLLSISDLRKLGFISRSKGEHYKDSYGYYKEALDRLLQSEVKNRKDSINLRGIYKGLTMTLLDNYSLIEQGLRAYKVPDYVDKKRFNDIPISKSVEFGNKALEISHNHNLNKKVGMNYINLAEAYIFTGQLDSAYYAFDKGINIIIKEEEVLHDWLSGYYRFELAKLRNMLGEKDTRYIKLISKLDSLYNANNAPLLEKAEKSQ